MSNTQKIISTNPAKNYEVIGEVNVSTDAEIKMAVENARKVQPAWRSMGVAGRVAHLSKLFDVIQKNRITFEELTTAEVGKPISDSRGSHDWAMGHFKWYLDNAERCLSPQLNFEDEKEIHHQHLEPYGVAGVIAPWNFPLSNFVMEAVQTLLAGNTIVYKISEEVPMFGKLLDKSFVDAGVPAGVFNQVYGDGTVGEKLVDSNIDLLFFTGSSAVGKKLYKKCGEKFIPCILELGGADVGIVFEDVKIEDYLDSIFSAKFINNGQCCCALKRLLVHSSIYNDVVEKMQKHINAKKVGNPMDEDTNLGSLIAKRQQDVILSQISDAKEKGAKVIECCQINKELQGAYVAPTLLTGLKPEMRAWTEELFGPVLPIIEFKDEEEAIKIANSTQYGLGGYVFSKDQKRANRVAAQIDTGSVSINSCDFYGPFNPFGGYKSSGMGKTGGALGFLNACRVKVVSQFK